MVRFPLIVVRPALTAQAPEIFTCPESVPLSVPSSVGKLSALPAHVLCFGLVFFAPADAALAASSTTARTTPTKKRENRRPRRCLILRTLPSFHPPGCGGSRTP